MRTARIIFLVAGTLGLLAVGPMYLVRGSYRYYGSLGGLVAWQIAFFVIATDPVRFRLMMIPAMMEKFFWVGTLLIVYCRGKMSAVELLGSTIPHAALGAGFVVAFFLTLPRRSLASTPY